MRRTLTLLGEVVGDAVLLNAVLVAAFLTRFRGTLPPANFSAYGEVWPFLTLVMLGALGVCGLYNPRRTHSAASAIDAVFRGVSLGVLLNVVAVYAARVKAGAFPTSVFFIWWALTCAALGGWRFVARAIFKARPRQTLVVGRAALVTALLQELRRKPHDYEVVGVMTDGRVEGMRTWPMDESIRGVAVKEGVEDVLLAFGPAESEEIERRMFECAGLPVRLRVPADLYQHLLAVRAMEDLDGSPTMELAVAPIGGWQDAVKRGIDIVASLGGMVLLAPLLAIVAALIRFTSHGPALYSQERVGKDGRVFRILKFRSMVHHAEAETGPMKADAADDRVTRLGRVLRRTRLDELPQLLNVLKGEMSLVGPRPERPYFVNQHTRDFPEYVARLQVRPGMTGMAQVYGRYDTPARQKVRYDLMYIQNHSLMLDLKILVQTIGVVLRGRGAR